MQELSRTKIILMELSFSFGTININGLHSELKRFMLKNYIYQNGLDVVFLQEFVNELVCDIPGYVSHCNIGTAQRGTAILLRNGLDLTSITLLPDGRGISGILGDILLVNIYAPSGSNNRSARVKFFQEDINILFRQNCEKIMFAGDFNCVTPQDDCT